MELYLVLWTILFAAPLLSVYIDHYNTGMPYDWDGMFTAWRALAGFFAVFALHNFLLAPLLVYYKRRWIYAALVTMVIMSLSYYQCSRPHPLQPELIGQTAHPVPDGHAERTVSHHSAQPVVKDGKRKPARPARPYGSEDMAQMLVMAMLLMLNVCIKYYFKSLNIRKRLKDLRHKRVEEQLKYLKYQINPHFFMNTLNNIHALVEFDPPKAQQTIEILSDLMRYVLYESDKPLAQLEKELNFVRNYVRIMRIRYVDAVKVECTLPEQVPDVKVPPLIFTNFLENAFKHGISYERPSFIRLSVSVEDGQVTFRCTNSIAAHRQSASGGVGLKNVQERLRLLYGNRYTLTLQSGEGDEGEYRVTLQIPYFSSQTLEP